MFIRPGTYHGKCGGCWHHIKYHTGKTCTGKNDNPDIVVGSDTCSCSINSFHPMVPDCICGHAWEDHHHGCIMNPEYPSEDHENGACRAVAAEECEATQTNGEWHYEDEKKRCYCQIYRNCTTNCESRFYGWNSSKGKKEQKVCPNPRKCVKLHDPKEVRRRS